MRKVLLTVMMVSSLLAFNACKKDGVQGPVGPAGPTGATGAAGAAGAVGAAGVKGADGTKILTGTAAPTTEGVVGDYYLQKSGTATILWGPKATAGWAGTSVSLNGANGTTGVNGATGATGAAGANGATGAAGAIGATGAAGANGATGANGSQFLAGAGVPTDGTGVNGDYYFNTTTSVFYGPKMNGTWTGTNSIATGTTYAAKTYTIIRGFEGVTEVTAGNPAVSQRQYGQDLVATYTKPEIFTSYMVTANDLIRIAQYPGWADDREMIFQGDAVGQPGIFNSVPTSAAAFGTGPYVVGAKFRYSRNQSNPTAEFTLTADDIARLTVQNGAAFGYLTYAKATPASVALGQTLVLYRNKNIQVVNSTTNFATNYTATTTFDLPALVSNFEKYKQDGKVFVKYKYYTPKTGAAAVNNVPVMHVGQNAGWIDLTQWANSFVRGTGTGFATGGYDQFAGQNPFGIFAAVNFMSSGAILGQPGFAVTVAPNQVATAQAPVAGDIAMGKVTFRWNIASGTGYGTANVNTTLSPTTLTNPGNVLDPVTIAFTTPSNTTAEFVARGFETTYYSAPALTATDAAGVAIPLNSVPNQVGVRTRTGGQEASYFSNIANIKLVQLQVFAIPGDIVQTLKAKGVDVNNINEISKYVKL